MATLTLPDPGPAAAGLIPSTEQIRPRVNALGRELRYLKRLLRLAEDRETEQQRAALTEHAASRREVARAQV